MNAFALLVVGASLALLAAMRHAWLVDGRRPTLHFLLVAFVYGLARHAAVWSVTVAARDSVFPYQFIGAPLSLFGISPVELAGWTLVAYLGWRLGEGLVGVNRYRIALAGFIFIAMVSLAVETAAIESHWWYWRMELSDGIFGKVPTIGIIDWGMVALEFLLPYLVWRHHRRLTREFWLCCLIFPAHYVVHYWNQVLIPFPFSPPEIFHMGLLTMLFLVGGRVGGGADRRIQRFGWLFASVALMAAVIVAVLVPRQQPLLFLAVAPMLLLAAASRWDRVGWLGFLAIPAGFFAPTAVPICFPAVFQRGLRWTTARRMALAVALFWIALVVRYETLLREEVRYNDDMKAASELFKSNRLEEAIVVIRSALSHADRHAEAYYYLGTCLRRLERWDEAAAAYQAALRRLEFDPTLAQMLVASLVVTGQLEQARVEIEKLRHVHPNEPTLAYLQGNVYARMGDRRRAVGPWLESLAPEESQPDVLRRADALAQLGHRENAIAEALRELERNPNDGELVYWLDHLLGDDHARLTAMYDLLSRRMPIRDYILKVGEHGLASGQLDLAARAYGAILKKSPDDAEAMVGMADVEAARAVRKPR